MLPMNEQQEGKPVVMMFYTVWAKGPTSKAAQRLDRQAASLSDQAHFMLVNCAPGMDNFAIQSWADRRKLRSIEHFKLLGPAPKYRPSNDKASRIIQGLARGYLARKYNRYAQSMRWKKAAAVIIQAAARVRLVSHVAVDVRSQYHSLVVAVSRVDCWCMFKRFKRRMPCFYVCQAKNRVEEHKLLNPDWAETIRRKSTMYKTPMDTPDDSKPWKHGDSESGGRPKPEVGTDDVAVGPMEAVARNVVLDGMKKRAKAAPSRFVEFCTLRSTP